jgi:hypothetical protein
MGEEEEEEREGRRKGREGERRCKISPMRWFKSRHMT